MQALLHALHPPTLGTPLCTLVVVKMKVLTNCKLQIMKMMSLMGDTLHSLNKKAAAGSSESEAILDLKAQVSGRSFSP